MNIINVILGIAVLFAIIIVASALLGDGFRKWNEKILMTVGMRNHLVRPFLQD